MTPTETPVLDEQPEGSEQQETPEESNGYGQNNKDLPEQLVDLLRGSVRDFSGQDMYMRRREVIRDRRNRHYERGYQHLYWTNGQNGYFGIVSPGGQVVAANGQYVQAPNFLDSYNLFDRYLKIMMAILTQNPPGIDFQPDNPDREEDVQAAQDAEVYRHMFDRQNNVKEIRRQTVRMFGLGSRCIRWTRTESNVEKWGRDDATGEPKQVETCDVFGTLESRVAILAKDFCDSPFCILYQDRDELVLKAKYPDFRDKIKGDAKAPGETAYERFARLGALQGGRNDTATAEAFKHISTEAHCWLRPCAFEAPGYDAAFDEAEEGDVNEDGSPFTCRDKMNQLFPDGVCVTFVGDTYVGSHAECMDDHLVCGFPYEGDGMYRLAMMDPMVVVQDSFNDSMNAAREIFDTGWPSTWVNAEDQEYDSITSQRADPYAIRQKKKSNQAMPLAADFFREPNPELPATFVQMVQMLQGELPQFQLATPPALFGAAMEDQKTASGYAQARAQAMGQQGLVFQQLQEMDAAMYCQAANAAMKNPQTPQNIVVAAAGENRSFSLERLNAGNFKVFPDQDSSFPESTQAKRANLQMLLTMAAQTPAGAQIFEEPDNWKEIATKLGTENIVFPEAEARDVQQAEIEELLAQSPVPGDPQMIQQAQENHAMLAMAAGIGSATPAFNPAQLDQPSVDINPWDFHGAHAAKCQAYLNSNACRKELARGNTEGVRNLFLHWQKHLKAIGTAPEPPVSIAPPAPALGARPMPPAPPAAPAVPPS